MHADNAGELTGQALKDEWAAKGIRLTACAPRQWRTMANDTRHILAVSKLPKSMWFYSMRGAVSAAWAIPINATETP